MKTSTSLRSFRVIFLPVPGSSALSYEKTIRAKSLDGARAQVAREVKRSGFEFARAWEGDAIDNTRDATFEIAG